MSTLSLCICGKYFAFCGIDCPYRNTYNTCITSSCDATQSTDYCVIKPMPKPTPEDRKNPLFDPIWLAIRGRKLECPEYYEGWQVATGEHVKIIINQIKEVNG